METTHGRLVHHEVRTNLDVSQIPLAELAAGLLAKLTASSQGGSRFEQERCLAVLLRLQDAIESAVDTQQNRFSMSLAAVQMKNIRYAHYKYGLPLAGAVHVDFGAGAISPAQRMFTHLMLGVRQAHLVELDPIPDVGAVLQSLARLMGETLIDPQRLFADLPITRELILTNMRGFDFAKLRKGDLEGVDPTRLMLHSCLLERAPIGPASVDVVVSNSVMEHVPDPDAAVAAMARITRSGGFGLHGIDTIDHRWYGNPSLPPFEFLTLESKESIVHGCNRLRICDYPAIFERHGFAVLELSQSNPLPMADEVRARLLEPWRSMPAADLLHSWGMFIVRKK